MPLRKYKDDSKKTKNKEKESSEAIILKDDETFDEDCPEEVKEQVH